MSAPSDPELYRLLEGALALPEGERAAYLDQHCRDRPEWRRHVEWLIEADANDGFLEHELRVDGELLPADTHRSDANEPERVGPYGIVREIGRGGMGQPGNGCLSRGNPRKRTGPPE